MLKKDANKRKLREPLAIGEKVLVLSERLKRKMHQVNYINLQHKIKAFLIKIRYLLLKKQLRH